MKIIIVGCGNVGRTLAQQLSMEKHDVSVIDTKESIITDITNTYDVLGVVGNGASRASLESAGIKNADVMIAVTGNDELNLLCSLIAKKEGNCHTIARVSDPNYTMEAPFLKSGLGLSMIINPQQAIAREISRVLKFPSALKVESFAKTRAEVVFYQIEEGNMLNGMTLQDMNSRFGLEMLVVVVERGEETVIPKGDFCLKTGDRIAVIATSDVLYQFFKKLGVPTTAAKDVLIVGGGRTTTYVTRQLQEMGVKVKIIEQDMATCEMLSEMFPKATIIHGDGTDQEVLKEEGLLDTDAFLALTNLDEVNVMLSFYAKSVSKAKLITRIHRVSYDNIIDDMGIGSVIFPKYIVAESIIQYVRAMHRSEAIDAMETLYKINDKNAEAMEFVVSAGSPIIGKPLKDIKFKKNMLLACIKHEGRISIPNGQSVVEAGDSVILVTTVLGVSDLKDALA